MSPEIVSGIHQYKDIGGKSYPFIRSCKDKQEGIEACMFVNGDQKNFVVMMKGIKRKTLAYGEKSLMTQFVIEDGATLPLHSHPHEQIGFLISGEMIFTIEGKAVPVKAGDSWAIPGGVEHAAQVVKKAEVIEVFVPIREDYLD